MPNYSGYSMDFEWDRAYFMPFLQMYCFSFGWISICLSLCLLYLLFNHSSMYSKEFRNAIALFHTFAIINDIHDCYLFTPYPLFPMPIFVCQGFLCRWKAPTVLLMTILALVSSSAASLMSIIGFMRLRNLLPRESRFRHSLWQCICLNGFTTVLCTSNTFGFALFGGDDPRKAEILSRPELIWLKDLPGSLVWGDMFDTPALDKELLLLSATLIYGCIFYPGMMVYSAYALHRSKKELLRITSVKRTNDQGNKIFQILLWGGTITFYLPLGLLISSMKFGMPTSNSHFHSTVRMIGMFLFINYTMVGTSIHLIMNRTYQKIITSKIQRSFGMLSIRKAARVNEVSMSEFTHFTMLKTMFLGKL